MQRSLLAMLAIPLLMLAASGCPNSAGDEDSAPPAGSTSSADTTTDRLAAGAGGIEKPDTGQAGETTVLVVRNLFDQRAMIEKELETLSATPELAPERIIELQAELAALDEQLKQLAAADREAVLSELEALAQVNSEIAGEWQQLAGAGEVATAADSTERAIALQGEPYDGPALPIEDLREQLSEVWLVEFKTTFGDFSLEVYPELSPIHGVRFLQLVDAGFYDNMHIHRIAPEWVIQWGDLYDRSDLSGLRPKEEPPVYPRYEERKSLVVPLKDEPVRFPAGQWTVCFAKGGPDTATTQPFINLADNSRLSNMSEETFFTPFAYVTAGRDNVERLVESFKPAMESARADLRAQLEADGAPEEMIEQTLLNDLAWQRYIGSYWDPFHMALIVEARIVRRPGGQ